MISYEIAIVIYLHQIALNSGIFLATIESVEIYEHHYI